MWLMNKNFCNVVLFFYRKLIKLKDFKVDNRYDCWVFRGYIL